MDTNLNLEIIKLVVQGMTPAVVGYLGWKVSKRLKDIEQVQWGNRKISEKRIQIYDEVSPLLNRIYCYFMCVGDWQHHTPKQIIQNKRELDQKIHINKYLLEEDFFLAYQKFIDTVFEHYTGAGQEAKLKTRIISSNGDRRKSPFFEWNMEFTAYFSNNNFATKDDVAKAYDTVMLAQRQGINA